MNVFQNSPYHFRQLIMMMISVEEIDNSPITIYRRFTGFLKSKMPNKIHNYQSNKTLSNINYFKKLLTDITVLNKDKYCGCINELF